MFTAETLQRHANARWNHTTREKDSEMDTELAKLLAEDNELSFIDDPTLDKVSKRNMHQGGSQFTVSRDIPAYPTQNFPSMRKDDNSISTFHPGPSNAPPKEDSSEQPAGNSSPSITLGIPKDPKDYEDIDVVSKMSNSALRISSLETNISELDKVFRLAVGDLQNKQMSHENMLAEILGILKMSLLSEDPSVVPNKDPKMPETANPLQASEAGGPTGATGC
jgi:hypothetical protein